MTSWSLVDKRDMVAGSRKKPYVLRLGFPYWLEDEQLQESRIGPDVSFGGVGCRTNKNCPQEQRSWN